MKLVTVLVSFLLLSAVSAKIVDQKAVGADPAYAKNKANIDKMVAFVKKAAGEAKANKDAALKEFNKTKAENGKFQDGELYIYAYDFTGVCTAHGAKAVLVGKNLSELKDKQGNPMIKELMEAAKGGSGFVEFFWEDPSDAKKIKKKLGYVEKVSDTLFVGSGIYFND